MCPYARFQSAMFDKDTLIITYDEARGEQRGARSRQAGRGALGLGDCIDCHICVQVCPTGIDIRNGLQYECIGCAACIDGCDQVMDRMGYPRGLIRYSTQNAMERKLSRKQMLAHTLRARVLVYAGIVWGVIIAAAIGLYLRTPLKVDVIRDRAAIAREVVGGDLENVYQLRIMNTSERERVFDIEVMGLPGIHLEGDAHFEVGGAGSRLVPMRVRVHVEPDAAPPGVHRIEFLVHAHDDPGVYVREKSVFIVR
jgi:cytochrome c oxidase accessory protein FixG